MLCSLSLMRLFLCGSGSGYADSQTQFYMFLPFCPQQKGTAMKIEYAFVNGEHSEVEVSEEIGKIILDSRRLEENSNRVYRRHNLSLEQSLENGFDHSAVDDSFDYNRVLDAMECLTEIQKVRMTLWIQGYQFKEIAEMEGSGVCYQAVQYSVGLAREKIRKELEK